MAQVEGPVLTARGLGKARVTARVGDVEGSLEVTVAEAPGDLVVRPKLLQLEEGQTKWIGKDVVVSRGGARLDDLDVVASPPSIVRYEPRNRSVLGLASGEGELAITAGDQCLKLPVIVGPPSAQGEKDQIVIEPSLATLAVGEGQDVRVISVSEDGHRTDRTGAAVIQSSDPHVLGVVGSRVTGITAGTGVLTATLPRTTKPGQANFNVIDDPFHELRVIPPELKIALGEERTIQIVGIGSKGRHNLSDHPDLKISTAGDRPDAVEWRGAGRVRGVAPGQAVLQVAWRGLVAKPVPVVVFGNAPKMLCIEPGDQTIEVHQTARFTVSARQGDRQRALSPEDGVSLEVDDSSVAGPGPDLTVIGKSPGTTTVTARMGTQRAAATVTVVPVYPPPRPGWTGLRFVPDILTMELGVPAAPVRLVKYSAGGQQEDVIPTAEVKVKDPQVADVRWTAAGPVFLAKTEGETEADATYGKLTTSRPLEIRVKRPPDGDTAPRARLEVHPDPLRLWTKTIGHFRRVQLLPGNGGPPVDIEDHYRVDSHTPQIVVIEGQKSLRAVAAGLAQVRVSPVGLGERYKDLYADVAVQVEDTPIEREITHEPRLVLSGCSRTTVGSEEKYHAEFCVGANSTDVTYDGAELVLDRSQAPLADVGPGCTLQAKLPGIVNLRARYKDQVSNTLQVRIDRVDENFAFARLELEIDRQPMCVGENRAYRLWAYPADGSPRQDITSRVVVPPPGARKRSCRRSCTR